MSHFMDKFRRRKDSAERSFSYQSSTYKHWPRVLHRKDGFDSYITGNQVI